MGGPISKEWKKLKVLKNKRGTVLSLPQNYFLNLNFIFLTDWDKINYDAINQFREKKVFVDIGVN